MNSFNNKFSHDNMVITPLETFFFLKVIGILMYRNQREKITWLPVSTLFNWWPFVVFQKRIHRSAVPPPDARRPLWWGDQAMALTAAVCSVNLKAGC